MTEQTPLNNTQADVGADQLMNGSQPSETNLLPKDASAEDVLKFNPFAAKGTGVAPDGKTAPETKIGEGVNTTPQSATQPLPGALPQSNVTDPSVQAIRDILLQSANPPAETRTEPTGSQEDNFKVAWDVPQELVAALRSDDPQQSQLAVKTLINGVANGVLGMMQQRFDELLTQAVPAMLSQRDQVQSLNSSFYGRHPHLKRPELTETVSRVAQAVAQQRKALGQRVDPFAEDFMDAVENYMTMTGLVVRPADHPLNKQQVIPRKPTPPHFGAANARPSGFEKPATEDLMQQIGI